MALNYKDDMLVRIYLILAIIIVPVAGLLMWRTVQVAYIDNEKYQEEGKAYLKERKIEAERGNIYSRNNQLLATSVPYFNIHFDPFIAPPDVYYKNLDSLAYLLATHVNKNFTVGAWRDSLITMRDSVSSKPNHYYKLAEGVSYNQVQEIRKFPIFNRGRLGGGLIVKKRDERKRPFGWLARRTIGKSVGGRSVGIEGAFDEDLAGESGTEVMFRVGEGIWLPTADLSSVEPKEGSDVHTTLDVNIQDIAENALNRAVKKHLPDWGTAIVMEVETGAIRAMANLGKTRDGSGYFEMYNYAIAMATEPGSTFKLATMMALLEDNKVTLDGMIDIENGKKQFADRTIEDSNPLSYKWRDITIRDAFIHSSNVAMAKLVDSLYEGPDFSSRLKSFHLNEKTGLSIAGEAKPFLNDTSSNNYSGISKAWMAFGYESRLTPLQTLTFFNSVANKGKLMKPYLVTEVRKEGRILKEFKPTIVDDQIARPRTIEQLQTLMEGVVERGTAYKLKTDQYRFAGKTGTSQQNYGRTKSKKKYQASFAGYFPAENPKYSIIVVIYNPRQGGYYGSTVAGPVFREIADRIHNGMIDVHDAVNQGPRPILYAAQMPDRDAGYLPEMIKILNYVNVDIDSLPDATLAQIKADDEMVEVQAINPETQKFPNVRGMRLRDATYVLENAGYRVHPKGVGRVVDQKWQKDARGRPGRDVILSLR